MNDKPGAITIGELPAGRADSMASASSEQLVARLATFLASGKEKVDARNLLREALEGIRALREDADSVRHRYIGLFNAVPDAVTLHDLDGRILDVNSAACRTYGLSREQLQTMTLHDLNPELPSDHLAQVLREHRSGEVFSVESTNVRGDGSRFPVEVHSALFVDRGQRRILAVARDISRRLATENELRASEERYRDLLQVMDKGVMVQDADGRVLSVNTAACRILGMSELELLGPANHLRHWRFIREDGRALPNEALPAMIALREGRSVDSTLIGVFHRDHRRYGWLSVSSVPQFMDGASSPFQVISLFSEVTELKRDSELFGRTQALARIGGWDWDPMQPRMYWTGALYDILQRRRGENVDIDDFLSHIAATDRARVRTAVTQAQIRGDAFDLECRLVTEDGSQRWARIIGDGEPREGERYRTSGTLQDITVNKLHEDELRRQALTDPLTQLANRDAILERIGAVLDDESHPQPALLHVDLDRFKVLNDLLGHLAADDLLKSAARRLRECVVGDGIAGRYSGDEFLVVMPDGSGHRSEAVAERINRAFSRPFRHGGEEFALTCSIGIARGPEDGTTVQRLIQSAESAMADAKRRGRNTW
ncbi:MAG: diguanylate cyclase, partial [Xanthomonadales bacterium]|nr:diguanylate cyclase [Xanthomonadales bacterium]